MASIIPTDIALNPKSLRTAIKSLEEAIEQHTRMREHLEGILALQSGASNVKPRGRPAKKRTAKTTTKKRAKRTGPTLREAIVDVLSKAKAPVKGAELRDRVLAGTYETSATPENFYTSVYNTARVEPRIKKTDAGFELRGGAGKKATTKKTAKKRATKSAGRKKRSAK